MNPFYKIIGENILISCYRSLNLFRAKTCVPYPDFKYKKPGYRLTSFYRHPPTKRMPHFSTIVTFPPTGAECQRTSDVDFGLHDSFIWIKTQVERQLRTRVTWREEEDGLKWKGGRENEEQQRQCFQGHIHLEAPIGRKMLLSCATLSVMTDSWYHRQN